MRFDPAVYPECRSISGLEKVECLIREIQKDRISEELKRRRINYLIALNAKQKWAPDRTVRSLVHKALMKLRGRTNDRRKLDPWQDPRFTMRFPAFVEVLYLTRRDIEDQYKRKEISEEDYGKYWSKTGAQHLEEFAIHVTGKAAKELKDWISTWGHKGGEWYMKDGYAIRCGGANQHRDPLNVFIILE